MDEYICSMKQVILLLGTNLGDCLKNLNNTIVLLQEKNEKVIAVSSVYKTEPWGYKSENWFYNMVLKLETSLDVFSVFEKINGIEKFLGRTIKSEKGYSDRLMDIDILFYEDLIINRPELQVPHPRLHLRKFTLTPLVEICPDIIHPVLNKTIQKLFEECKDEGKVIFYEKFKIYN